MSRLRRVVVGPVIVAAVAAGLVLLSGQSPAQQPGDKGFEKKKEFEKKKGFEGKKGFEKKGSGKGERGPGFEKKDGPGGGEAVRVLEAELRKLREVEADLEAKLHQLRGDQDVRRPGPETRGPDGRGPGGFGPPGGMGGRGPGFGMGGPGGRGFGMGGPGGGGRGGPMGGPGHPNFEQMSPDQLSQVIGHLQQILEQKTRQQAPQPRTVERGREARPEGQRPGGRTEGRGEDRRGPSQDDVMRRLDQLSRELDEIRRAIRK
jgi:hypothetical protein